MNPAVQVSNLTHRYGQRVALDSLNLIVNQGEVFGLLGPNGGGKTTLFRILTTYFPVQDGQVSVLDLDVRSELFAVRSRIGVVFQSPSLDKKLTVFENLKHHARLYGLSRSEFHARSAEMLSTLGLADRRSDLVETLSGGLARRVELAKGLLHRPELLILDEPSTGLDPGARRDLWQYLRSLRPLGVTVLVTTHLMEEAERCDRVAILDRGKLVAAGSPDQLRGEIGGEIMTLSAKDPQSLAAALENKLGLKTVVMGDVVRLEHPNIQSLLPKVLEIAGGTIESLSIARPTLEDVFIRRTGHRFWSDEPGDNA